MREPRNPFRLRAAEAIENDVTFLKLFGPGMLDLLGDDPHLWDKPQLIRSAPGAGKTTLLRLFTPAALVNLHAFKANEDLKELYQRMVDFGVINEGGPQLLGVFLSCARNYRILDDLDFEPVRKQRLLFGLLNARIVLATLRASLQLKGLHYPEDLARIKVSANAPTEIRAGEPGATFGIELHRWATNLEENVCDAIDSFDGGDLASTAGKRYPAFDWTDAAGHAYDRRSTDCESLSVAPRRRASPHAQSAKPAAENCRGNESRCGRLVSRAV